MEFMPRSKLKKRKKPTTEQQPAVNSDSKSGHSYYYDDATGYEVFRDVDEDCEDSRDDDSDQEARLSESNIPV